VIEVSGTILSCRNEKATAAVTFPQVTFAGLERCAAFLKGKAASAALFDPTVRKWNGDGGFLFSVFCD
jgi:hypothetical protein